MQSHGRGNIHLFAIPIAAQNLVEADASVFIDSLDGISSRVEVPNTYLVRLWIYIHPWRLYENLSARALEALGLDPSKGVTVCFNRTPSFLCPFRNFHGFGCLINSFGASSSRLERFGGGLRFLARVSIVI